MVVVEVARGVGCEDTNKIKNSGYEKGEGKRTADDCDKEEGERTALVIMAKMLQKPK